MTTAGEEIDSKEVAKESERKGSIGENKKGAGGGGEKKVKSPEKKDKRERKGSETGASQSSPSASPSRKAAGQSSPAASPIKKAATKAAPAAEEPTVAPVAAPVPVAEPLPVEKDKAELPAMTEPPVVDTPTPSVQQPQPEEEPKKEETKPVATVEPEVTGTQVTKKSLRLKTWSKLDSADVILFPMPCMFRIPRFKGELEAVQKLAELDVFKKSKVIKVSLDKAHECVRLQVIESGKEMIAGCPGLREAVFLHIKPPVEPSKASVRMASSRGGISHLGTALDFNSETKADLVVIGSVAVDRKGHRIGKGEGFSDLEYALLMKLGGIVPNAPIVTIVHDLQVYDSLPDDLFKPFDVPVDYIVTPTQVIEVKPELTRPTLIWNILSNRRVNNIPIIKQLLDREQANGLAIELKGAESDAEERPRRPQMNMRRRYSRKRREMSCPAGAGGVGGGRGGGLRREGSAPPPLAHNSRTFRRRPRNNLSESQPQDTSDGGKGEEGGERRVGGGVRRGGQRRVGKTRYPVDFSVRINGLTSGVRIRDLKAALIERGVRPRDISWRGPKGVALLHFSKVKNPNAESNGVAVDEIVRSLQGLQVKGSGNDGPITDLNIEPAKPITRIDVIDVSTF